MSIALFVIIFILAITIGVYILGISWYLIDVLRYNTLGDTLLDFGAIWMRGLYTILILFILGFVFVTTYKLI